jgi:pSer/pThr/pTyr-binding forkhead associated (FHA) protein
VNEEDFDMRHDSGAPYLRYRDGDARERVHQLDAPGPVTIGRSSEADIALTWDARASRAHARLELVGDDPVGDWTVVDDGPSRNGTFVNGQRVHERIRLRPGDRLVLGGTAMRFCAPTDAAGAAASPGATTDLDAIERGSETMVLPTGARLTRESLSDTQRRVLAALARPVERSAGAPATDEQIAAATFLSTETIRATLTALCLRLGLQSLPEDERRAKLAQRALASGVLDAHPRD